MEKLPPLTRARFAPVLALILLASASAQTTATIDIDTTSTTPIHPGFSGVSDDLLGAFEYWDYRFNSLAVTLDFGWVRFPGGNTSDAYNWQTGQETAAWLAQLAPDSVAGLQQAATLVAGKGGARLIDAANRANFLGAGLIVCANGFTDTPQSIGQLAAYVQANRIPVAAWELSNEAYLFPDFFPTATAYLDRMRPYRDAIKAVDPNAIVAIFIRDPANTGVQNSWNRAIAAYPDKYWDAISFHHYPPQSSGAFAEWMADESAVLANKTSTLVTGQLAPIGPPGVKFLNTEFDPSIASNPQTGAASLTKGTLWGAIYAAEYTMRMSTVPSLLYVGPSAIWNNAGIEAAACHDADVTKAANQGQAIDTLSLDFGFYIAAQANGLAVLNPVINHATQSNKTTVTGGATVPATGITAGIPALYAMSYSDAAGGLSVVITNKSATAHKVTLRVDGAAATGTFPLRFITGTDPVAVNTAASPSTVSIQTGNSANPVTVPPYSVLRAGLKTPPVVTVINAASQQQVPLAPSQQAIVQGVSLGDTTISITDSAGTVWPVPLDNLSPGQATFQMPDGIVAGPASVTVSRAGKTVLTGRLMVAPISPGIYSANGNGAGAAAATAVAVNPDGTTTPLPVYACQDGIPQSCLETPLNLGDGSIPVILSLSATGIRYAQSVTAYIAGQQIPIQDFQPQPTPGFDQVDIPLPPSLAGSGEVSVYIIADGVVSNMTTINIQ